MLHGWLLENRVKEAVSSFWLWPHIMWLQGMLNSKTFIIKNLNLNQGFVYFKEINIEDCTVHYRKYKIAKGLTCCI